MKIFRSLDEVPQAPEGRSIALGTFDGVHLGHRAVIAAAVEQGAKIEASPSVVTFDPHPARVLRPDTSLRLLSPLDVKAAKIADLEVAELLVIPFTKEFAALSAETFLREVLEQVLGARFVSVGENFRFGSGAEGDAGLLRGREGFATDVVPTLRSGGEPVSSTRIRGLIERGAIGEANTLLGAPFVFEGQVVAGEGRGRELGVPTGNIVPPADLVVPGRGVYAALARAEGDQLAAAVNVGSRPTFESDGRLLIEAHLIDFDGDLYDSTLRLSFLERLREETRFESASELVDQMHRDLAAARKICAVAAQGVSAP